MIDLYFEIRKRICPFDEVAKRIPTKQKILDLGFVGEPISVNSSFINDNIITIASKKVSRKTSKIIASEIELFECNCCYALRRFWVRYG